MPKTNIDNKSNASGNAGVSILNYDLMDVNSLNDVQKSLREQNKAFKSLIDIVNQDQKDLNKISWDLFNEK